MEAKPKPGKHLNVLVHGIGQRGGMERVNFEVFTRLVKRGWTIHFFGYRLEDWPKDLPIVWHRIPGRRIPSLLLKILWYQWIAPFYLKRKGVPGSLRLTSGTDVYEADIRIIHFLHHAFAKLVREKRLPLPNGRTFVHRLYQSLILRLNVFSERKFLSRAKLLIVISERVAGDVCLHFGESIGAAIKVIRHAPDTGENIPPLSGAVKDLKHDGVPLILFVGALERKGIERALRCLGQLKDLNWQFWVVGGGNVEHWKTLARALGIEDRTTFFGHRPAQSFFPVSDILLFPSIYEPFGLVITEAISQGCVPLASTECGAMELWSKRDNWLKLSVQDPVTRWVEALRQVLTDPSLRKKLCSQAREAMAGWTWDRVADAYESSLEEVGGDRNRTDLNAKAS